MRMSQPAPIKASSAKLSPWLLRCERIFQVRPAGEQIPGGRQWLWARDPDGNRIELRGQLEDGFLVLQSQSDSLTPAGKSENFEKLRTLCSETIARDRGGDRYALGHIRAAREREKINVPLLLEQQGAPLAPPTRLVIFGDSLSDSGNLRNRLLIFPAYPYWVGRFSNGPNWADYLERLLDVPVQNHAYGGASVHPRSLMPKRSLLHQVTEEGQFFVSGSMHLQIEDYLDLFLLDGQVDRPDKTIFILWGGANDYLAKLPFTDLVRTLLDRPGDAGGYKEVAQKVVNSLAEQVQRLYEAGGRNFLVMNLPDLGRTPVVLQNLAYGIKAGHETESNRKIALSERLTALIDFHNKVLASALAGLRESLPGIVIQEVDTQASFDRILDADFRFEPGDEIFDLGFDLESQRQVLDGAGKSLSIQSPCFTGNYIGRSRPEDSCPAADRVVFWDNVHPTTFTHCWQAYLIAREMQSAGWLSDLASPEEHKAACIEYGDRRYPPATK